MRGQLSKEQRQQQVITRLKNENIRLREELKDAAYIQFSALYKSESESFPFVKRF